MKVKIICAVIGAMGVALPWMANAEDSNVFRLGEILVTAPAPDPVSAISSTLTNEDIRQFNRETVADALNLLPGVTLSNNLRNEQMVSVRGYDVRQVPLFIDGIPVYVPYDGYVDFGRFVTSDLAAIQVSKGFSSVSYGPNTLGGAINLISRRPSKELEGDVRIGYGEGSSREAHANIGTNQGSWYFQASAGYRESNGFRMSDDFKPTPLENGGRRNNSQYKDDKVSLKFGLTPNDTDEYAISYYKQNGEKGQPPSTEPGARFWKWPFWDKESLYFVSNTALGAHEALKVRLYVDEFDNELNSYTDGSYRVLKVGPPGPPAFVTTGRSIYHDKTYGGSIELESRRFDQHTLRFVTHYKNDRHKEVDANGVIGANHEDTFRSFAVEDTISLGDKLALSLGFAHHELSPDKVMKPGEAYTLPDKQTANDPQAALFYDLNPAVRLYASVAQKTRLPTLKDRYSSRLGNFIENPNLQAEEAVNYEIGYQGSPWAGARAEVAVFYNDIEDKIQEVRPNPAANCGPANRCQMQNVGEVRVRGLEVSLQTPLNSYLDVGGNFTRMDLDNRSNPNVRIIGIPETKLILHTVWRPVEQVKLIAFMEQNGGRWASNTVKLDRFTIFNLKGVWEPREGLFAEVGVNNLSDRNYELDDGFPSPGRMWYTNLSYVF
ncbi:Colicin I receptor [Methylophilaceae bacterium]|nr:Colicin I receptor [Methylophilaceae bacterium]